MIFRFNNLPQNGDVLISIDNSNFLHVTCAEMDIDLSNGLHKVKVIFKSFHNVKRRLGFLSKKNPHFICLNTSINSFEQEFSVWVKKQGYIEFDYSVSYIKDRFNCVVKKPYFNLNSDNVTVNEETYYSIVPDKKRYMFIQVLNILLIMLIPIAFWVMVMCYDVKMISIPIEVWRTDYRIPRAFDPIPTLILDIIIGAGLSIFYFCRYYIKLTKQAKNLKTIDGSLIDEN